MINYIPDNERLDWSECGACSNQVLKTGFKANDEKLCECLWEDNLISHRLESNWS